LIFALTPFHRGQQAAVWGLPEDFFWLAGNGIDLELVGKDRPKRDPKKLIYAARPERGLDVLLSSIFPKLLKHDPKLKLYITTYDFFPPSIVSLIQQLRKIAEPLGDSVVWLPPLSKKDLYRHLKTSQLYVYPTDHEENYCILAAEAQACGLPMVTRDVGAIPDILSAEAGYIIQGYDSIRNPGFQDFFVKKTIQLLSDRDLWKKASEAGIRNAQRFDWNVNAKRWDVKMRDVLAKNNPQGIQPQKDSVTAILTTDNDARTLEQCLGSIADHVDEVVVADLGSKDGTLDILKKYGCKVINSGFDVGLLGYEDPRNRCLREANGRWIFWLNPDEMLLGGDRLGKYLRNNVWDGYSLAHKFTKPLRLTDSFEDNPPRIFRNRKGIRFQGICCERPNLGEACQIGSIKDVVLLNTNTTEDLKSWGQQILPLLERDRQKYPERLVGAYNYMKGLAFLVNLAMANGGGHTDKSVRLCQTIIGMYQGLFRGKAGLLAEYALVPYSEANAALGQGMDVIWNMSFDRMRANGSGKARHVRFLDIKDFRACLETQIVQQTGHLFDKYFLPQGL
jgi:glycosyltransferase involved in cell wall biosynthesis